MCAYIYTHQHILLGTWLMGERAWLPHECFLAPNQGTPCLGTSCMQTTRTVSPNHLLNNSSTGDKVLSHWWCLDFVQSVLGSLCCTVHRPLCLECGIHISTYIYIYIYRERERDRCLCVRVCANSWVKHSSTVYYQVMPVVLDLLTQQGFRLRFPFIRVCYLVS